MSGRYSVALSGPPSVSTYAGTKVAWSRNAVSRTASSTSTHHERRTDREGSGV